MRTSSKAILGFLAGGVVFGGLAYTGISMYGTKPDITDSYELQLLRGTSKYVQAYDGPNARDALTYAGYTVNIVSESRNVKIPG